MPKIICDSCKKFFVQSKLRKVTEYVLICAAKHGAEISINKKICNICYLNFTKSISVGELPGTSGTTKDAANDQTLSSSQESSTSLSSNNANEELVIPDISSFNTTLSSLGSSPIAKKRMSSSSYTERKASEIQSKIRQHILNIPPEPIAQALEPNAEEEIIQQLKNKFKDCTTNADRYLILTTLPISWSARKIENEFGVSFFMANQAKKLQISKGIMSTPDIKLATNTIPDDVKLIVKNFYEDDDISRVCPGKRDYQLLSEDGVKVYKQRRLLLCNLQEAYSIFKQSFPEMKIGFSKFASYRPEYCVLANSSGTHTICVCIYHQNIKLIFEMLKKNKLLPLQVETYKNLLAEIICEESSSQCHLLKCEKCPGINKLQENLLESLGNAENITFKQWTQVDRCHMDTITQSAFDFTEIFCEKLRNLLPHHFIAEQQSKYLKSCKENITKSECIMISDFSENYSFVIQDAVQGFHWANAQCTIHPFAIYYKDENDVLQFTSIICISEVLKHNHVAVRLFWDRAVNILKQKIPHLEKIINFSDGSGGQYKNKMTFYNISQMKKEYGLEGEWNFFATCHGKGPCDALGGVLKTNATKASLQNKEITTAEQLYRWAISKTDSKVQYEYFAQEEFSHMESLVNSRYNRVKTIRGTQKYHSYTYENHNSIRVKEYSFCDKYEIVKILK